MPRNVVSTLKSSAERRHDSLTFSYLRIGAPTARRLCIDAGISRDDYAKLQTEDCDSILLTKGIRIIYDSEGWAIYPAME